MNALTLTVGNSAKLYCLNWIENQLLKKGGGKEKGNEFKFKILDLGCGAGLNFVNLLKLYPQIHYVGIEPSKPICMQAERNLKGLNASIINAYAYNAFEMLKEKFDVIVSFSALEHVYRREEYLRSAKECLKEDGYFQINYDAGHFVSGKERRKNIIGPILARVGIEKYYQSFVKEEDFLKMIDEAGLRIIEAKFFNTHLKGVYKVVPKHHRVEYMKKWLEFELWLNELGIEYTDSLAPRFVTRNFILTHK